jgi:hypothetical protein
VIDMDEFVRIAGEAYGDDPDTALAAIRKLRQLLSNIESEHLRQKAQDSSEPRSAAHRHWPRRDDAL